MTGIEQNLGKKKPEPEGSRPGRMELRKPFPRTQEETKQMFSRTKVLCAALLCMAVTSAARAELLNLNLLVPDIESGFIDVMYDASGDMFSATGFALAIDYDGIAPPDYNINNGSFDLSASIDDFGSASSGSLAIGGDIPGLGVMGSLLTGSLTDFGFQTGGGDLFEFLFTVTGGQLAGDFGGLGATVGVILNADGSTFTGDWTLDFNNNGGNPGFGLGVADTAFIPAPAGLAVLLGAGFCAGRRRRRG
jgi:hypothetical protein